MKHYILGFGSIGKRHYRNLKSLTADPIITVDPDPSAGADQVHLTDSLANQVVYICSPTPVHAATLAYAIEVGAKAVFVEKPLCAVNHIPRTNIILNAVGYCYRFHPTIRELKERPAHWMYISAQDDLVSRYGPTALETMASHSIDAALWILGPARSFKVNDKGKEVAIEINHEGGRISEILCNIARGPRRSEISFYHSLFTRMKVVDIPPCDQMYIDEMKAWLNYLETGEQGDLCSFEEAMEVQRIMQG